MKKIMALACLCLCCIAALGAAGRESNMQKIHPVDSDIYMAIQALYLEQGLALPSSTGPWSSDELQMMLDKIDEGALSEGATSAYEYARSALESENKSYRFTLKAATEAYYHANTQDFTREEQWIRGFDERSPFLGIVLESWLAEHFYGYSSFDAANNHYSAFTGAEGATSPLWGANALTTNIPLVPPAVMADLDFNFPARAFGSAGGRGWNLQIGRDRLSWGPGESGNFMIGDQLLYHNMGKLTGYTDNFKYSFLGSFFPHPSGYYPVIDGSGNFRNSGSQDTPLSGLSMFIGHRLEWRLFSDKAGIALTEAIMYQSTDNTIDLFVLSPTAIFHNYYIRGNANSMLSLELDYTPIKHLNVYGQVVVDEFRLPGEPKPGVDPGALPNGFGFMAGLKASYPLARGMLHASVEWARTDPFLYLRDMGDRDQDLGEYGINWVVALREFSNHFGITYTEQFLGYEYGGDAIVYNINGGYREFGAWSVEANLFFMRHGTHDKWTVWGAQSDGAPDIQTTPTSSHVTENNGDLGAQVIRNSESQTLVAGVKGAYKLGKNTEFYAQADYVHIAFPGNIASAAAIQDLQLTVGCAFTL